MLNCESLLSLTLVKANMVPTLLSTTFVYRTQYPICIKLLARNLPNLQGANNT